MLPPARAAPITNARRAPAPAGATTTAQAMAKKEPKPAKESNFPALRADLPHRKVGLFFAQKLLLEYLPT